MVSMTFTAVVISDPDLILHSILVPLLITVALNCSFDTVLRSPMVSWTSDIPRVVKL